MKIIRTEEKVVAELNGKFWGYISPDPNSDSYGFIDLFDADLGDPEFIKQPTDFTGNWNGNPSYERLKKAKLVKVKITIETEEF